MTPVEYQSCLTAYYKNKEVGIKEQYELLRFHAWMILPTKQGIEPVDLVRFKWEEKEIKKGRVLDYGETNSISKIKSST